MSGRQLHWKAMLVDLWGLTRSGMLIGFWVPMLIGSALLPIGLYQLTLGNQSVLNATIVTAVGAALAGGVVARLAYRQRRGIALSASSSARR